MPPDDILTSVFLAKTPMSVDTRRHRTDRRTCFWRRLWKFRRARSGTSAVEFGLIAGPFFLLLFALIEIGMMFLATFTLENAVGQASRMIRTGQAQDASFSESQFKAEVCSHVVALFDCAGSLIVDVRKFDNFTSVNVPDAIDDQGNLTGGFQYDPGNGGDIVVVRIFYEWDVLANLPALDLGNMNNGNRLLAATASFRNEPFDG